MCKCRSHGTFPLFGLQSSHLNICYYHQDPHRRPLRPGSRPRFCSDRRALLLIGAWHLPRRPGVGHALKRHPFSGLVDSAGMLTLEPFSKDQGRSAVHPARGIPPISFLVPCGFTHPLTRTHVRLLGPCFKTGRMGCPQAGAGSAQAYQQPRLWPPHQSAPVHAPSRSADRLTPFHIRPGRIAGPHSLPSRQFQALFDSLFKVLFIFPSRYLFAIGLTPVFSLGRNLPPYWGCIPKQPDSQTAPRGATGSGHDGALTLSGAPFQGTWARSAAEDASPDYNSDSKAARFSSWADPGSLAVTKGILLTTHNRRKGSLQPPLAVCPPKGTPIWTNRTTSTGGQSPLPITKTTLKRSMMGGDAMRDAQAGVPSTGWLQAQLAFKNSMVHGILQFTPSIAFCYVLHRCVSRDIRCRESFVIQRRTRSECTPQTGHNKSCPSRLLFSLAHAVPGSFCRAGFDNDPSAGSPTETLLRLLLPLNDKLVSRLRSRSLTELTRQIAPPTKNGHAPPPIESRKSSQSVNPYYVWTWINQVAFLLDTAHHEAASRHMENGHVEKHNTKQGQKPQSLKTMCPYYVPYPRYQAAIH
ncbi:hypothetical protein LXL04_039403 [Taraxacum kok-saghyz]